MGELGIIGGDWRDGNYGREWESWELLAEIGRDWRDGKYGGDGNYVRDVRDGRAFSG
ncbi:MAG: hypothetical protein NC328_00865 [Muribaculum sp.]|nr:hypothetical protein [Muribaculum sp.]